MKGRLIAFVGISCIAILIASGAYAKPGESIRESIAFKGDLIGDQVVEGCCPNAGPFPEYTMTLGFWVGNFPPGTTYKGQLFINYYGAGRDRKYKVQFWSAHIGIQIIGGVIVEDRKNNVTTVTFTNEPCVDMDTTDQPIIEYVDFSLVRRPN